MQNIQPLEFPIGLAEKIADYGVELILFIDGYRMPRIRDDPKIRLGDMLGDLPEMVRGDAIVVAAHDEGRTFDAL
jgi:hypothetical protein